MFHALNVFFYYVGIVMIIQYAVYLVFWICMVMESGWIFNCKSICFANISIVFWTYIVMICLGFCTLCWCLCWVGIVCDDVFYELLSQNIDNIYLCCFYVSILITNFVFFNVYILRMCMYPYFKLCVQVPSMLTTNSFIIFLM